ncbi:TPA: hypothetical protein ACUNCG_000420 [Aeromonas hydrophila]
MARYDNKNIKGLDDLNRLLDSITDDKFRARALRNTAKKAMQPVKSAVEAAAPAILKGDVVIRTTVNTTKKTKIPNNGKWISDKKYNELYSEVSFKTNKTEEFGGESAYGMAMILEFGRRNPLSKIGRGNTFKVFGKVTDEVFRYIGTTQGLYFVERVRVQTAEQLLNDAERILREEIENEIRKQDKRRK